MEAFIKSQDKMVFPYWFARFALMKSFNLNLESKGIICLIGNRQLRMGYSDSEKGTPKEASSTAPIVRKTAEMQVALRLKDIPKSDSYTYCRVVAIVRHRV